MTSSYSTDNRVTAQQLDVWRSFVRVHARLVHQLEADLMEAHGLPLAWYYVLSRLLEADQHQLRMSELADQVMLSPSGLTRLVDRLVEEGLVERIQVTGDGRGFYAGLTDVGYSRLREASGTHLRGVRDRVIGRFTEAELTELARYLERLDD